MCTVTDMLRLTRRIGQSLVLKQPHHSARVKVAGLKDGRVTFWITTNETNFHATVGIGAQLDFTMGKELVQVFVESLQRKKAELGIGASRAVVILREEVDRN